jgi:hypothetical protein
VAREQVDSRARDTELALSQAQVYRLLAWHSACLVIRFRPRWRGVNKTEATNRPGARLQPDELGWNIVKKANSARG